MGKLFFAVGIIVSALIITCAPSMANDAISGWFDSNRKLKKITSPLRYWESITIPILSSLRGPKGDPGPPGADGKDGLNGKDGAPGADGQDGIDGKDGIFTNGTNVYSKAVGYRIQPYDARRPDNVTSVQALCPPGGHVAGGGHSLRQPEPGGSLEFLGEVAVLASEPIPGAGPEAEDGWRVVLTASMDGGPVYAVIRVFVICID